MTGHAHVRDAEVHPVDQATCVHRLLPVGSLSRWRSVSPAAQCPRQPGVIIAGMPACLYHAIWVIGYEHSRGNPDVVVRPWP